LKLRAESYWLPATGCGLRTTNYKLGTTNCELEEAMTSEHQRRGCEFQLLRYVPDAVRNEYVHIGVILRESATADDSGKVEPGRVEVRFTRDWRRVRCLDPDADTALLEGMEGELRRRLQEGRSTVAG
jgi:hypothetical protein